MTAQHPLPAVASRFALGGEVVAAVPFTGGHINDSWQLTVRHGAGRARYLLQRINDHVFRQPQQVMENVARVTRHLAAVLAREGVPDAGRRTLTLVSTVDGASYSVDPEGGCWRAFRFIEGTVAVQQPAGGRQAYEAARAFGAFQRRLGDYRGPRLHETIPGFHDAPRRVAVLEQSADADACGRAAQARGEIEAALAHRALAHALLAPHARGEMPERIVHNDAKIANVLFDAGTGEALCVVDLDTVMPGLALYDFGDMVRSMTSLAAEDEAGTARVEVQAGLFEAVAAGYLDEMGALLTPAERGLLVTAARLITYEQAVRFLTDFLDGDRYYRTTRPGQNLDRCRVQLGLLEALTREAATLERRL